MLEGNKSVGSWKEKNVTLKEKHLEKKCKKTYGYFVTRYMRKMCVNGVFFQ
jgi:hypothetical protein